MNRNEEINKIINDLDACINLLSISSCDAAKNNILDHMRCKVYDLFLLNNLDQSQETKINTDTKMLENHNPREFTIEELALYNGKNNMPAYIGVNGTVYDVTNNAAWAAATHFGYSAGKDLTTHYNTCHGNAPVLDKLPVVGKLI